SVSISGDWVAVGAPHHTVGSFANAGAAYVYSRTGGTWPLYSEITDSSGSAGANQGAVALHRNFIGSWPRETLFTASDAAAGDTLGDSVALDGTTMVAGAPLEEATTGATNRGAAYVAVRSGSTWAQQAKVVASDFAAGDQFGTA